jgi:hypothetical protein
MKDLGGDVMVESSWEIEFGLGTLASAVVPHCRGSSAALCRSKCSRLSFFA